MAPAMGATGTVVVVCYGTALAPCTSPYMDRKYGRGKRVANLQGGKGTGQARCTNCGQSQRVDNN